MLNYLVVHLGPVSSSRSLLDQGTTDPALERVFSGLITRLAVCNELAHGSHSRNPVHPPPEFHHLSSERPKHLQARHALSLADILLLITARHLVPSPSPDLLHCLIN
ncbi:hypothetical protein ILYODFUR_028062 [Ilyodon furcidens]|uniref:Uncharacterized protein n=1 Tax=Ilyodon furcidens TaxID=33524 RepID=A0ABV0U925_9TELE